jgi:high-affinity nickel permease
MHEGRRPITVGFFFSLGHSTIAVGLVLAIALAGTALQGHFGAFKVVGGVIGARYCQTDSQRRTCQVYRHNRVSWS